MKKNALPTSKAKTAYELLSEIAKLALEEPKRIAMDCVVFRGRGLEKTRFKRPTCGTVGCIAGWALTLRGRVPVNHDNEVETFEAHDILGITNAQGFELFYPDFLGERSQTKKHAEKVAKHIAAFQEKYAEQLEAKMLRRA